MAFSISERASAWNCSALAMLPTATCEPSLESFASCVVDVVVHSPGRRSIFSGVE
jgi:hypothetical protein